MPEDLENIIPAENWEDYDIEDKPKASTSTNIVSADFLNGMSGALKEMINKTSSDYVLDHGFTDGTYWVKMASGEMTMMREYGSLGQGGVTWVFPIPFIVPPYVGASTSSGSLSQLIVPNVINITGISAIIYFFSSFTARIATENVVSIAKGRWK
ncbi:hypothetical protein G7062_11240 [Erysipelothrix sp. HDW6C]|uniref:hypothetical protein n=1 Tax=Erysipelothrix sp. HDW6C TaxID=2714930 RepID=UPI0014083BCA|nr:hypothetical protein [Erysipelothrix sp. HDW6C]QIK70833.1 hypothetical protein G7062_11240 [Erysipelothrix sp. HDW6C]